VVAGSNSPLAREQVAYTQAAGTPHIGIPIEALDGTNDAAGPICTSAVAACLRSGSDVLVTVTGSVGAGGSNDSAVTRRLGTLLQPCAGLATGLVLTGGDTAAGVLRAWGAEGLRLIGELQPGIAFGVTVGAGSLGVITKPGAFGGLSCLTDACAALRAGMAHGAGGVT
jgi:4-hydroxythreonine-4-phosphate dehydrogenase